MVTRSEGLDVADLAFLERARKLAKRGWGHVHPNPMVGCLIVRDGRVVGEGYHARFGGPHAEVVALDEAGAGGDGATAYVSLEPCRHVGKTPPCTEALLRAGVTRVVYGAADPGSDSAGGGDVLRAAGVRVDGPVLDGRAARADNPVFFHASRSDAPFVALKLALSLDARIAAEPGRRTRITGEEAEREVHRLRKGFDAVLIGAGTARTDDPRLTVRQFEPGRVAPRRVVLSTSGDLGAAEALFQDVKASPLHVFVRDDASPGLRADLEKRGAAVHAVAGGADGLDLDAVWSVLSEEGVRSVFCEGGARLAASLLSEARVDRLYLLHAPVTLGARGVPAFPDDAGSWSWALFVPADEPTRFGRDTLVVFDRQED